MLVLACLLVPRPSHGQGADTVPPGVQALARYVTVQEALAADDEPAARAALAALVEVSDAESAPLARAALDAEGGIEGLRHAYRELSEYYANLQLPKGYAGVYCPMYEGGSRWVQREGPIRNPYHGKSMLTCGVMDAAPGAHMDHTPRHGGIVFMAPDSFHHLEGTYPEPGLFRLHVTDNYREPVDVSTWAGRAVIGEVYDADTDEFQEVSAFPLTPAGDGSYLEARVGTLPMPAEIIAKVVTEADFPAERFDFIFAELTAESAPAGLPAPAGPVAVAPAIPTVIEPVPLAERIKPEIPATAEGIVSEIVVRDGQIQELIGRGAFAQLFVPALQAKELALALLGSSASGEAPGGADGLSPRDRQAVGIAARGIVRGAWLLDWYGDLGNKQQVNEAYRVLAQAIGEIRTVYGVTP